MNTDTKSQGIHVLLTNRIYLYLLLKNFFGDEPTLETLDILYSYHTQTALSLLSINKTLNSAETYEAEKEAMLEQCRSEYTRLFIGPTKLPAPLWESVYTSKERLIFQESTLSVRKFYLKYNLLPIRYRSEPDDHLALELEFMVGLCQMAEAAFEEEKIEALIGLLKDQLAFLEEHLLVWTPQFAADLEGAARHPLYADIAVILREFLQTDRMVLQEIIETI